MYCKLREVAEVSFGLYEPSQLSGSISYLQAKHFNNLGIFMGNTDVYLEETKKTNEFALIEGDVLFVSKGFRYFAAVYSTSFGRAIASSVFFVIKTNPQLLTPAYLAIVLNSKQSISYFQQLSAGSTIPSIRKNELLDFRVKLISIEEQQKVIKLNELNIKQIELNSLLLEAKQKLFEATISKIIN